MKLKEQHTYQCDVCEEVITTDSKNLPTNWCEAWLNLNNGYTSSKYLVCNKHGGNERTWEEKRKNVFQILLVKSGLLKIKATYEQKT
jgi:hypothetical protein